MIELDPEKQRGVFMCRRIVPEEGVDLDTLDQSWVKKLNRASGGRGDLILRNKRTQIPKGFKLVEEIPDGQVVSNDRLNRRNAIHVCNKSTATSYVDGWISVKWVKDIA